MLHSDWLLKMMEKSGADPKAQILALFDILHDWTEAPGMRPAFAETALQSGSAEKLLAYLTWQTTALRLPDPEAVAHQIYCIALGALQAQLAASGGDAFVQARSAAAVLLDTGIPRKSHVKAAALTASVCMLVAAVFVAPDIGIEPVRQPDAGAVLPLPLRTQATALHPAKVLQANSPDQVASLHDSLERIRRGVCQYPQALMLPPEYRAIFIENVVNGSVSPSTTDMPEIRKLVQKVECYYPPVAMTAS